MIKPSHYSYLKEILKCYTTQGRSITDPYGRYTHRETFASLTVIHIEMLAVKNYAMVQTLVSQGFAVKHFKNSPAVHSVVLVHFR